MSGGCGLGVEFPAATGFDRGRMLGYYVHDLNPFLVRFSEAFGIRWYGVSYLAAFLVGFLLYRHLARKGYSDLQPSQVADFITGIAIFGVLLGGRLGYMVFYDWHGFLRDPASIIRVWEGGMSAHGGIVGVALYSFWYAKRNRLSWLNLADNLGVVAPIGIFFGRLANFINGELYGRVAHVAWAVQFPKELYDAPAETVELAVAEAAALNPAWNSVGAIIDAVGVSPDLRRQLAGTLSPRHPSQIYEALLEGAVLFAILWVARTRFRLPNGVLTGMFFVGYAVLRSFAEVFREPDVPMTGFLTRGQFLSIFLAVMGVGIGIVAFRLRRFPVRRDD
jgi:phosphatidylglycerol:prolipoprotein diacylglycerol transferase